MDCRLIFPNIEMRLGVGTVKGKWVNIHLLVSPEDPNHLVELKRVLARLTFKAHEDAYCCNKDDLIRLGQRFDPKLREPAAALQRGSEQFKVSFDNLRKAFTESSWARENILIAIAGSETDGTSGVRDGADATLRQEMQKFAHIIFASSAAQRDFWLGRRNLSFPKIISGLVQPGQDRVIVVPASACRPASVMLTRATSRGGPGPEYLKSRAPARNIA
jgi:hypothetical protein